MSWKSGREIFLQLKSHKEIRRKGIEDGDKSNRRPHGEDMKRKISTLIIMCLFSIFLSGCSITFSDGQNPLQELQDTPGENTSSIPSGMVESVASNSIDMKDISLQLPEGMKYGKVESDSGNIFYVWKSDKPSVYPTDSDIILYIYEGIDGASPDAELTDKNARLSITQTYIQVFRQTVNGTVSADPVAKLNGDWFALQLTGYSGDYIATTYNTLCYPKYYYGIYTLQKGKSNNTYSRRYYGFIFSNDGTGKPMSDVEYNALVGQIKKSFTLSEFYTTPQLSTNYQPEKDFSHGYTYDQFASLFENAANYYGMSEEQATSAQPST